MPKVYYILSSWLDSPWGLFFIVGFDSTLFRLLESIEAYEEGGSLRPRELGFAEEGAHDREPNHCTKKPDQRVWRRSSEGIRQ